MRVIAILVALVLGAALGAASALHAAGITGGSGLRLAGPVDVDGWQSDWTIGSPAANPWTRARIARHGLLALSKEEAVYFSRTRDADGQRLSEACTYRVSGGAMPGDWWSITLYDAASFLPRNEDKALSFDQTRAEAAGAGEAWQFIVSAAPPGDGSGWVSSRQAGAFDLTLRLYKPQAVVLDAPGTHLNPPRIERLGCAGDPA